MISKNRPTSFLINPPIDESYILQLVLGQKKQVHKVDLFPRVKERLGHQDIQTTLDIYGHVLEGGEESAAMVFEDIFSA